MPAMVEFSVAGSLAKPTQCTSIASGVHRRDADPQFLRGGCDSRHAAGLRPLRREGDLLRLPNTTSPEEILGVRPSQDLRQAFAGMDASSRAKSAKAR
jgi:hypothetical protein